VAVRAYGRLAIGVAILALGLAWLASIGRAGHRSAAIQRGPRAEAAVERRQFVSGCLRFTCDQTRYQVRYLAEGRVWRAHVLVDGWRRDHPPGSLVAVVYDPAHPGRVEVAGQAPSRTPPTIGAWLAIVSGAVLALAWAWVIRRDRAAAG
jgi:hypothetical protein